MIIYGKQVCLYALEHKPHEIESVYIVSKRSSGKHLLPQELFHKYHSKIKFLEEKWAQSMSKGGNHQGILVEMKPFVEASFEELKQGNFLLLLDTLTDVGNIGAIVRTAYALGVDGIIASGIRQLNFAAITRTSSGALLQMPFMLTKNTLETIHELKQKGFLFYGATMDGEEVKSCHFTSKRVLVLGSEGAGISKKVNMKLDKRVSIKMKRDFDSLNVSVAAAILIDRMNNAIN
jgi:23S rRNA (guanosine2251-2'-O)-methyltransferase